MLRPLTSLVRHCILSGLIVSVGLLGVGCGGYSAPSPSSQPTSVTVSPASASVPVSGMQNFAATVMNDYLNRGVTWALSGSGCSGATCGSLSNVAATSVTYNAPAAAPNPNAVVLTATSVNNTMMSATAMITVTVAVARGTAALSVTTAGTTSGSLAFSNTALLLPFGSSEPEIALSGNFMAIVSLGSFPSGTQLWTGDFGSTPKLQGSIDSVLTKAGFGVVFGGVPVRCAFPTASMAA